MRRIGESSEGGGGPEPEPLSAPLALTTVTMLCASTRGANTATGWRASEGASTVEADLGAKR